MISPQLIGVGSVAPLWTLINHPLFGMPVIRGIFVFEVLSSEFLLPSGLEEVDDCPPVDLGGGTFDKFVTEFDELCPPVWSVIGATGFRVETNPPLVVSQLPLSISAGWLLSAEGIGGVRPPI